MEHQKIHIYIIYASYFLQNNKDISYTLQAVGCHRGGTIKNGHYETYVRNNSTLILISDCQVHI